MARRMLGSTPMKRAALVVALVAAMSSVASAGTYVGLGIGTNAVSGSDRIVDDGRSARLVVGYAFRPLKYGTLAVEGSLSGYGLGLKDGDEALPMDAYQISAAARFNVPLSHNFEAFGRLGLHHTTVGADNAIYDTSGNGFLVGAGIAYLFDARIGKGAAVSIDYQLNKVDLEGERFKGAASLGLVERQWTLGVTLGF
jgi:hypothetical protein